MDTLRPWLPALSVFAASLLAGLVLQSILLARLKAWAERTHSQYDDLFVESLSPLPFWVMLVGLAGAAHAAPMPPKYALVAQKAAVVLFLVSLTFVLSKLASAGVRQYSSAVRGTAKTTGIVDNLVRGIVLLLGALLVLSNLGISVTPILGALGVGSLAVALALQDTLTNLFAGVHIVVSEIVSVGDYVRLDSGQEGTVTDVAWRVTRIRELSGNDIILPNSKLANAVIVNFQRPGPDTAVGVPMSVAYGSDLEKVERVALEIARELQRTLPGATRGHEPAVRFNSFGDSAVNFAVGLRADSYPDRFLLIHEFIKRAHKRFAEEGLEIPYPQRVVHLRQP